MAETTIKPYNLSVAKNIIGPLAQTNHFQVTFSSLRPSVETYLKSYLRVDDVRNFLSRRAGILCDSASLPTTAYATAEVRDNFMGVPQQFAHTRIYIDSDFSFYIDDNYNVLKFFEGWMDYISGDDNSEFRRDDDVNYYRRFNYPMNTDRKIGYKCGSLTISKFEKNFGKSIKYSFINAFPKAMISIPVQYGGADLLKVNVQFAYDRYNLI